MEYVLIGKIINTFGLKGDLKVISYTDFENERFKKGTMVYVGEKHLPFEMKSFKYNGDQLLIRFKDNEDINLVEKYKGMEIFKSSEDIKPLKKGEYYFSDLMGLDVYVEGEKVGIVKNVEEGVMYNFLRVKNGDQERLVPFIERFIESVDLDKKMICVVKMEGLL